MANRDNLKVLFSTGKRPSGDDFAMLIDKCVNIEDDKATDTEATTSSINDKFLTPHSGRVMVNPLLLTKEPSVTASNHDDEYWSGSKTFKRVREAVLTGLVTTSDTVIAAGDQIVQAFGKLQAQINGIKDSYRLKTQFITLNSDYTTGTTISFQKIFNSTTNGAFNLAANKKYKFRGSFSISQMHGTNSGTFSFGMLTGTGMAGIASIKYTASSIKSASPGAAELVSSSVAGATVLVTASNATEGTAVITGVLNCNAAGKLVPAFSLSTGIGTSNTKILANSYFEIEEIGDSSTASNGWI